MNIQKVLEEVKEIIAEETGQDIKSITENTRLETIGAKTGTEIRTKILNRIWRTFSVSFYKDEWEEIKSVNQIVTHINKHRS